MSLPVGIVMFFLYVGQPSAQVSATPVEPGAMISNDVTSEQVAALAALVSASGYRCDTVSGATRFIFSHGFNLYCNNHRYSYEIEDKGGRWTVTVD
jgi:hypothetical protein